jgi:hypothetical protein
LSPSGQGGGDRKHANHQDVMTLRSPAGKPATPGILVNVPSLMTAYDKYENSDRI